MSKQFNKIIFTKKVQQEILEKQLSFTSEDFPKKDSIEISSDTEIRLFLDRYSNFREFEQSETASTATVFRSSFYLLNRGIDLLEEKVQDKYNKLLLNHCTTTQFTEYGIGICFVDTENLKKKVTFNATTLSLENPRNITETDVPIIEDIVKTNLYCFANFHDNLTHESTYSDGYSSRPVSEVITNNQGHLVFVKQDINVTLKIQDTFVTPEILENIRNQVKTSLRDIFRKPVTNAIKLLKRAMRRFHRRKMVQVVKIQKFIRKEKILCLPKLAMFLKWKQFYLNNKQQKQARLERLNTIVKNPEMKTTANQITIEKLDILIEESKQQYIEDMTQIYQDNTKLKPLTKVMLTHLSDGNLYEWLEEQKKKRKSLYRELINRYSKLQHKQNLKIASIRSGFISNKKFLEREKWFGFNRNKQLGNMLLQNNINAEILSIDWNDCIIEENSRKIKIALSQLCRLTKTKQYIAFCNTSYCIKKEEKQHTLSPLHKMFCTILGFNNYTYQEFAVLIINHMDFVSKNKKGINWITKYLGNIFDKYQKFLETVQDKEKCLRWCDISKTKLCLCEVDNKAQTFIDVPHVNLKKEEIVARSYNAGVFKYIKEAIKLIKNRSKVMVKKWKDFCDENDIENEEIQLLNENTIYDRLAIEIAKESNLEHEYNDY